MGPDSKMVHIDLELEYVARFKSGELTLLCKSLAGRPLTETERKEALHLNAEIQRIRLSHLKEAVKRAEHATNNAQTLAVDAAVDRAAKEG